MLYTIRFYDDALEAQVLALPRTLMARYLSLADRMVIYGPNLGEPHTKAMGDGLFEMRLKGLRALPVSSIARWWVGALWCCTALSKRRTKPPATTCCFPVNV